MKIDWSIFRRCLCCGGGSRRREDGLVWEMGLKEHATGNFSIAVAQANESLEDQGRVVTMPSATYIGVFDGHGGPEASRFVNHRLFSLIHELSKENGGLSAEVFRKAFDTTEEEFTGIVQQTGITQPRIASVGSCCLVGAIEAGTLYVANLGDSRAVLGMKNAAGVVVAERLSRDHNVAEEEVRAEVVRDHPDDSRIVVRTQGVWRIKGIIQVSRSIGDVYLKKPEISRDPQFQQSIPPVPLKRPVMTSVPSIRVRKLQPQDTFVIFASDGLWEQLSDENAVDIVFNNPRKGIAKRLVKAALNAAAKKREMRYEDITKIEKGVRRHFHDDITVIVIFLDDPKRHHSKFKGHKIDSTSAPIDVYSLKADELDDPSRPVLR
ncbi:Phosphatase 2C family protein [Rhynchospora pubera]|uniref:protein-serine/threonine phosphatase n=1 Tax=Rhynchospora pubera TaxID=906938 RepID=A0AAV8HUH4_9POAL|nr:Phosphatase 2C family protein [Rhynchospora pubera]